MSGRETGAFVLPAHLADQIVSHARRVYPHEVCGLISGRDGLAWASYPGRNVSATPAVAFEMDVETLALQMRFEDEGLSLVGIYHSHPAGPEVPSPTDVERASYPEAVSLICSLRPRVPLLRAFRIANGRVAEIELIVSSTDEGLTGTLRSATLVATKD